MVKRNVLNILYVYIEKEKEERAMRSLSHTISLAKRAIGNYFTKRPFCVSFEVTFNCNALCKHCNRGGPVEEQRVTPERYGEISRQIKPLVAQLSGGEPLLRNDLEQIVDALSVPKRAPYIVVITNGVLLTKERYCRLREAGADRFSLSLDYPDERHDEFRGVPGLFSHITTLIKELSSENNKEITLCCVIQSDNFKELVRMAELAREWNVSITFSAYTCLRTNDESFMLSSEELEEFREIIERLLDFNKKHRNIFTSDYVFKVIPDFFKHGYIPNCRTGERFLNVNPEGTLSPCGLIRTDYQSQKELREKFSKSNTCVYCYTSIRANSEKPAKYLIKDIKRNFGFQK